MTLGEKIHRATNNAFKKFEKSGFIKKTPNFILDYQKDYPKLKILEDNYEVVRKECEDILAFKDDIMDIKNLLGDYTKGGIHVVKWKSYVLKSGDFVQENCKFCPETTKILKQIPRLRTAFFSILDPNQYITPHEGYYNGFMRYHLGVIIPNNNENDECWIRIANDKIPHENLEAEGDKYYWKNGEGVLFNDNYSHDAKNESDQIRVILWLDVERKLPFPLRGINAFLLNIMFSTQIMKNVAKNAIIKFKDKNKA
ncbi:MAG: aspartyl/asparaginyl beta-hydroxylase domain-containing protein [Reichenbachiella sp.]|uniref:aspartyl/asparaginyl beta-hydroxylase domain-containing protein n=1 Tax=Reichenbachiella sp. TaxID=2184521 RepID=UPI003266FDF1